MGSSRSRSTFSNGPQCPPLQAPLPQSASPAGVSKTSAFQRSHPFPVSVRAQSHPPARQVWANVWARSTIGGLCLAMHPQVVDELAQASRRDELVELMVRCVEQNTQVEISRGAGRVGVEGSGRLAEWTPEMGAPGDFRVELLGASQGQHPDVQETLAQVSLANRKAPGTQGPRSTQAGPHEVRVPAPNGLGGTKESSSVDSLLSQLKIVQHSEGVALLSFRFLRLFYLIPIV